MKGECVGRELQRARDLARRQALRPGLHQQAEHVEPIILRECGKGRDSVFCFHISTNIEI